MIFYAIASIEEVGHGRYRQRTSHFSNSNLDGSQRSSPIPQTAPSREERRAESRAGTAGFYNGEFSNHIYSRTASRDATISFPVRRIPDPNVTPQMIEYRNKTMEDLQRSQAMQLHEREEYKKKDYEEFRRPAGSILDNVNHSPITNGKIKSYLGKPESDGEIHRELPQAKLKHQFTPVS